MTSNIQISGKSDSGVIFVVGGENYGDFYANLVEVTKSQETADSIVDSATRLITPASATAPNTPPVSGPQAVQNLQNAGLVGQQPQQPAAGGEQFCPSHQRPVIVREKKDGSGSFAKCQVNDTIVSNYGKPGLREYCPKPKQ